MSVVPITQPAAVVIDHRSGARGTLDDWVNAFAHAWAAPEARLDRLIALLAPDIVLEAPTSPPVSVGWKAGRAAFERAFKAMPDLTAAVDAWSASGDGLFIAVRFKATIGGKRVEWRAVDHFTFDAGEAVRRTSYFDPTPLRAAFVRNPKGVLQYLRLRSGGRA